MGTVKMFLLNLAGTATTVPNTRPDRTRGVLRSTQGGLRRSLPGRAEPVACRTHVRQGEPRASREYVAPFTAAVWHTCTVPRLSKSCIGGSGRASNKFYENDIESRHFWGRGGGRGGGGQPPSQKMQPGAPQSATPVAHLVGHWSATLVSHSSQPP